MHYGDRSMTENVIRQKKSYTSAIALTRRKNVSPEQPQKIYFVSF